MPKKATPKTIRKKEFDPLKTALQLAGVTDPIHRLTTVDELLESEEALSQISMLAGDGASITTVEMSLGLLPGVLRQWLKNGQTDPDGPYRILYHFYLQCSAKARMAAEITLLVKNPAMWLEKVETLQDLSEAKEQDVIQSDSSSPTSNLTFMDVDDEDEASSDGDRTAGDSPSVPEQ